MSTIEQSLKLREVVGLLRTAARTSTSKRRREDLRAMAKKIETRRQLNLSTGWWVNRAVEMVKLP